MLGEREAALELPQPFLDSVLPGPVGVTVRPEKHREMIVVPLKFLGIEPSLDSRACCRIRDCFECVHTANVAHF